MNKTKMRATLTLGFCLSITFLFSQNKRALREFTEITGGMNYTQFTGEKAASQRGDWGWQFGMSRRHQLNHTLDLSYGAELISVKHQVLFEETTTAYVDKGFRGYDHTYFRVPVDVYYQPIARNPFFISGGLNMSSDVHNVSAETFIRTQYVDDSGYRYEHPTEKSIRKFRETGALDIAVRLGVGTRIHMHKMVYSVSIAYNQGLLNKDMGLKQQQLECQMTMTLPRFKASNKSFSLNPGNWLD